MAGPNDQQERLTPGEYSRRVRASLEQRQQHDMANRQKYQPYIHSQMQRLFRDYQAPLYARVSGLSTKRSLAMAESVAVSFAAHYDRRLEDSETQAVSEHLLTASNNNVLASFATTGFALFMTWRGRRTMKFPFFNPPFVKNPGPERSLKRAMGHGARLVAYYVVGAITLQPVLQALIFWNRKIATDQDPRLTRLLRDAKDEAAHITADAMSPDQSQNTEAEYSSAVYEEQKDDDQDQQSNWSKQQEQAQSNNWSQKSAPQQSSWGNRSQSQQQQQQSARADPWASDDFDDASPVASASQSQRQQQNTSGSAWDRVRQHSQPTRAPQRMPQEAQQTQSWGQQSSGSSSWGPTDDEDSRVQTKAQRDFDAMLEKERKGSEQGSRPWGR